MPYRGWGRYVSAGERRQKAAYQRARLAKQGQRTAPVVIEGRKIAHTFWGQAWCENLERYSDYANRLPRGRTYARNGSVLDLVIAPGKVEARVSGSRLYRVEVTVAPLAAARWKALRRDCAGAIDSVVELLQGRFARGVMERLCDPATGLFPAPAELRFACTCPDWAVMCKHVAASLYGVGARLDQSPELFFTLRQVDGKDLIAAAGQALALPGSAPAPGRILVADDLGALFGLEFASARPARRSAARKPRAKPGKVGRAGKARREK